MIKLTINIKLGSPFSQIIYRLTDMSTIFNGVLKPFIILELFRCLKNVVKHYVKRLNIAYLL